MLWTRGSIILEWHCENVWLLFLFQIMITCIRIKELKTLLISKKINEKPAIRTIYYYPIFEKEENSLF